MIKIDYEIKLNSTGRPCIDLPKEYQDKPEDKFFVIELARYVLQNVFDRRSTEFDQESSKTIETCINLLGQIGDEMAELLWQEMKTLGDISFLMGVKYHVMVKTTEERNALSYNGILDGDKIYKRQVGLKVLVTDETKIYELQQGIDNENWKEV